METLIIMAVISVANWALHKWVLKPHQERAKAAKLGDFALPRATEDAPVPLFYGRVKLAGGNVVWMGKLTTTKISDGNGNIVGYNYFLPFQMVFGIPGGVTGAKLGFVWVDDRLGGYGFPWLTDRCQLFIDAPIGSGTMAGTADWYGGDPSSGYISTTGMFESDVLPGSGEDPSAYSTFKGYALATFFNLFYSPAAPIYTDEHQLGFAMGTGSSPGALAVEAVAACEFLLDPSLDAIGDGDANPANMLFDLLTNKWARIGLPASPLIDTASFIAAGTTLAFEQHGISLVIANANDAREIIAEVLAEIAGVMYQDPETQAFKLRLIREDYTVGSLPVFDQSKILRITNYTQSTWSATFNELRVVFRDRERGYTDRTAFSLDLGNYAAQQSVSRTLEKRFPGISNMLTAATVCARELRALSRPLRRVRFLVDRSAFSIRPGDVFVLQWPDYGFGSGVVMRAMKFDLGTFDDNKITIDCLEDVFAIDQPYLSLPPRPFVPLILAHPLVAREADEAPRWLQLQALAAGRIASVDVQRAWWLAVAGTNDATFQGRLSLDGATFFADNGEIAFPATATVGVAYARTLDPYDTSTGLVVAGVTGIVPATLVAGLFSVVDQIAKQGANLVRVGDEIIAYETATDLGGGSWRLTKVWRGVLDTVPADHAVGERCYFISDRDLLGLATDLDVNQVGQAALAVAQTYYAHELPYAAGSLALSPESALPIDTIICRGRTLLPYPVADLQLATSKTPAALQVDAIDVAWRKRTRLSATITRGDAGGETVEAGSTWDLRASKLGLAPAASVALQAGLTGSAITRAALGKAGHGSLSVEIRSQNANGSTWQDAALPILASFWRNLLADPQFAFNDGSWSIISGTGTAAGAGGLGNGPYATGNTSPVNTPYKARQVRDVTGYNAVRLAAHVAYYAKNTGTADTAKLTIAALDASSSSLGSVNASVVPSSTVWTRYELTYANLPAGTTQLLVELEADSATPLSASPGTRLSDVTLRLGQGTGTELLANPDFETGLTSWTTIGGALAVSTAAPLYTGAQYLVGTTLSATNTLRQEATLPAGYEFGLAVFECGRGQPTAAGAANTGEVKLMAIDGGGAILATATTTAETFTADTWTRRRLTLEIPATTTKLRVDFVEVAGAAGSKRAALDDASLYVWKHLDPDSKYEVRFDAPKRQALPSDTVAWEVAFPGGVRAPDYLLYDGTSTAAQIGTGDLTLGTNVRLSTGFVGCIDPTTAATEHTAIDFSLAYRAAAGLEDARITSNPATCNFTPSDRWAVVLVIRAGDTPSTGTFGLCGRRGAAVGWTLKIVNGVGVAEAQGSGGTVTATGTTTLTDGAIHYVGIAYDGTNLHLYDEAGDHSTAAAAAGDFHSTATLDLFRLGRSRTSETSFAGQIARCWVWRKASVYGVAAPTSAQIAALWTHGGDPSSGALTTYTRSGGALACPVADGATTGAKVAYYGSAQYAPAYAAGLAADGGTGYGLATLRTSTNLVISQNQSTGAGWASSASLNLNDGYRGPDGLLTAALITGPSTEYRELAGIAMTAVAAMAYVIFYVKSGDATAFTMRSRITDSTGATVDTFDVPVTADGKWIRVAHAFAWSGATATMRLRFYPTTAGVHALGIAGPYFVGKDGFMPLAYSAGAGAASASGSIANAFPAQLNAEGEIVTVTVAPEALPIVGSIATLRNGVATNADKRRLYVSTSSSTRLDHYDSAAASNTAATSGGGIVTDRTTVTTERGRWNQAEVFDAATVFTNVEANLLALATGRAATWTRSAAVMANLDIANDNGSDRFTGAIRSIVVWSRETKR